MDTREFTDTIFGHFARVGSALGNLKRVQIVDVLAQGERSVEDLAHEVGSTVGNTSRNLQVLARAGLVTRRVDGTSRIYRLSDPSVLVAYRALVDVAQKQITDVNTLAESFFAGRDKAEPIGVQDLKVALEKGEDLTLIDVRSPAEYQAGHVPGAISVPVDQLADHLAQLPKDSLIVAYCRGPYCVMAADAVNQLRDAGYPAVRLAAGYIGWQI